MAERRSMGDAMKLTPEKMAFIEGRPTKVLAHSQAAADATNSPPEKTIDVPTTQNRTPDASDQLRIPQRRANRPRARQEIPGASELLDQVLVPVTIRLQHRTAQALKRAYLEQKLKHLKPNTVQEIGEEALADWLQKAGYLD